MIGSLMGLKTEQGLPGPSHDFWYTDPITGMEVGGYSDSESAMALSSVYSCVRVLSEGIAALPLKLYKRRADGGKEPARDHPLYTTLHDSPNYWSTSMEFWELAMKCLSLRGNSLSRIRRDGTKTSLEPILPQNVLGVKRAGMSTVTYEIRNEQTGNTEHIDAEKIFHVRGLSNDGLWGCNPIQMHRESIGLTSGAAQFGLSLFKRGVRPSGVIEMAKKMSDEAFARLRQSFGSEYGGSENAAKTIILEDGASWKQVSMTPEDAQFIETRRFQLEEIARIFRVPPHMLQDLSRSTFSNIEHQSIDFVVHTLRPWMVRIEQAIKRDLIHQKGVYFAEFNADAILRGDSKTRYEQYALAVQNEIMNQNEVRELENMNPRKGGDEYKNPAINPQDNKAEMGTIVPKPEEKPENSAVNRIVESYAKDIASRMASFEISKVEKRAKHADQDIDQFNDWVKDFYTGHAQRIDQSISGLCDALEVRESDRIAAVSSIVESHASSLTSGDPQKAVADWTAGTLEQNYFEALKGMAS